VELLLSTAAGRRVVSARSVVQEIIMQRGSNSMLGRIFLTASSSGVRAQPFILELSGEVTRPRAIFLSWPCLVPPHFGCCQGNFQTDPSKFASCIFLEVSPTICRSGTGLIWLESTPTCMHGHIFRLRCHTWLPRPVFGFSAVSVAPFRYHPRDPSHFPATPPRFTGLKSTRYK